MNLDTRYTLCLLKVKYSSQTGYNVVWDFVETLSQMMENFLFEEKNLRKLGIHYKTKKVLDKEIINKIIEGKISLILLII